MKSRTFFSINPFKLEGRIATQPVRVFGIALYVSVLIVEIISWNLGWCGSGYSIRHLSLLMFALAPFVALEIVEQHFFPRKPLLLVAIGVIALRIVSTEIGGNYSCSGFHTFFWLIPPILAYLYIGPRAALITTVINMALFINWLFEDEPLTLENIQDENMPVEFFIMVVGMIVMLTLARTLFREERNRERAEQLLIELEQSQQQLTELAKVEERNRIARDIHDSVGHHLMAVTVQLEKAKAYRQINPQEADLALEDAQRAAQSALADVRESVSTLRTSDGQFVLASALTELVERFDRIQAQLTIEGNEGGYAKPALMALYRAAQEGLTNIEKHASATRVNLDLALGTNYAELTMRDNGVGFSIEELEAKQDARQAHFGLLGLRERVELQGGTLSVDSERDQGTTLTVRIPARGLEG